MVRLGRRLFETIRILRPQNIGFQILLLELNARGDINMCKLNDKIIIGNGEKTSKASEEYVHVILNYKNNIALYLFLLCTEEQGCF